MGEWGNPQITYDTYLIEPVQHRFLSFAGFLLSFPHEDHDYTLIVDIIECLTGGS